MRILQTCFLTLAVSWTTTVSAADHAKLLAPYIDDMTFVVAHLDVTQIQSAPIVQMWGEISPETLAQVPEAAVGLTIGVSAVKAAGVEDVYYLLSMNDLPTGNERVKQVGLFIIRPSEDASVPALVLMLKEMVEVDAREGNGLILVASESLLNKLSERKPTRRPELIKALASVKDSTAQVLILPPEYAFRVVEEIMQPLPKELGGASGKVLSEGVRWAALGISLPPETAIRAVVQSQDAHAAETLRQVVVDTLRMGGQIPEIQEGMPTYGQFVKLLTPQAQGDQLRLDLSQKNGAIKALVDALEPVVRLWESDLRLNSDATRFKQIGLALHNWVADSKQDSLPAPATFDAKGKPLLSWRVHLLPYLGHADLYQKFHLDEPWDSENNKRLIAEMPDVYASGIKPLKQPGMTRVVFPIGEGTVIGATSGSKFSEIRDGTSNTVLVVETDAKHAVIWTQPVDLPFDPADPTAGLEGHSEDVAMFLYCDGSVRRVHLVDEAEGLASHFLKSDGK